MPIQDVQNAIAHAREGKFVTTKDLENIEHAAGQRLGRDERAATYMFMQDIVQHRPGIVLMPGVEQAAQRWLAKPGHQIQSANFQQPGAVQAQMMANTLQVSARATEAQGKATLYGALTAAAVTGAAYAGYGAIAGSWSGPGALVAAGIGFFVGAYIGYRVAAATQLHEADSIMKTMQGAGAADPDDLE